MTRNEEIKLVSTVNTFFGVDIVKRSRKRELVDVKHAFRYVMRDLGYGLAKIGNMMNCDHATVLHSYNKAHDYMAYDKDFTDLVFVMKSVVREFHAANNIRTKRSEETRSESILSVFCMLLYKFEGDQINEDELEHWLCLAGLEQSQYRTIVENKLLQEA